MSNPNATCTNLLREVGDGVGGAVIDLTTGRMLANSFNEQHCSAAYIEAAVAAIDMYRSKTVAQTKNLLRAQRRAEVRNTVRETQMTTDGSFHFLPTLPGKNNTLAILITSRQANRGLGRMSWRNALPRMATQCQEANWHGCGFL